MACTASPVLSGCVQCIATQKYSDLHTNCASAVIANICRHSCFRAQCCGFFEETPICFVWYIYSSILTLAYQRQRHQSTSVLKLQTLLHRESATSAFLFKQYNADIHPCYAESWWPVSCRIKSIHLIYVVMPFSFLKGCHWLIVLLTSTISGWTVAKSKFCFELIDWMFEVPMMFEVPWS